MSDKVLSQEEIDALYSAMSDGQIHVNDGKQEAEVSEAAPYDLSSQKTKLHRHFDVLEEVYDKFSSQLKDRLSGKLKSVVKVELISTEIVKFGEFLKNFSKPTSFNVFSMEPLHGNALLILPPNMVFSLVDCLLGGKGRPIKLNRDFTVIEQRLIQRLVVDMLKEFERAWEIVHSVRILLKNTKTNPDYVHVIENNDQVLVSSFSISGEEYVEEIYFCVPYLMLEPIKEALSYGRFRAVEARTASDEWIKEVLGNIKMNLIAELGRTTYKVRQVIELKVGDVIQLKTGPQDPILLKIENVPKFTAVPGIQKGNLSVRISDYWREKRETNTDDDRE